MSPLVGSGHAPTHWLMKVDFPFSIRQAAKGGGGSSQPPVLVRICIGMAKLLLPITFENIALSLQTGAGDEGVPHGVPKSDPLAASAAQINPLSPHPPPLPPAGGPPYLIRF